MTVCVCVSRPLGEHDILIDPTELLGKRLDFQLILDQCCGLRWVKEARTRGIQIGCVTVCVCVCKMAEMEHKNNIIRVLIRC